ncbi:MAG: S9 family peptidase, partial [Candidatus Delongbacteria bacterium]|nr:S9 family peptidase [Candidatus Delongbacteria bacterium]MBN2836395.1 S9 family peptidase [Candidatus Delongbacteria bacterium]
ICYSPDRNYLLFVVDLQGLEIFTTFILDVDSKSFLEELTYSGPLIWLSNSKAFLYESSDDYGKFRWSSVKKHIIGTEQKEDEVIHYEADEANGIFLTVAKSEDGNFIYLDRTSSKSSEYRFMEYNQPDAEFKIFSPLVEGEQYKPFCFDGYFYIICNTDNAPNFKLMKTSLDKTEKQYWQEIIPHSEDTYFTAQNVWELDYSVRQFKDYLVFKVFHNGKQKIRYINTTTDEIKEIKLDIDYPFYEITLYKNEFKSACLKFSIQSYSIPRKVYEFDLERAELKFVSQDKYKGFNQELYASEIVWATSPEGIKIPISLFYRKDLFKKDGTNPFFLEAYGAYGAHDYEYFDSKKLSLVDRGFVCGEAHVRGGGYLGKQWHLDGIGRNRVNRFKDFITCSEYLIQEKYTTSDKLVAYGRSAGGQIMGAVLNMRPDLYKCVLVIVPGMDVLNAFYDKGWHLINDEIPEEGDIENKKDFEAMLARDPYYQIKATNFPHVFTTASLNDSRAYFWRPLKWFCKLREFNTGNNIQIIKTEDTGHWSGTDKYSGENHFAELYAFAIWVLGK